ncbi:MAG: PD-(D/E)XK nuclease family protein [Thermomicrobiales bacterium]
MEDAEGPRWPVAKQISPTAMRMFQQCPHKTRLRYVDQIVVPEPYSIFLNKGNIAHDLLARQARLAAHGKPYLEDAWMLEFAFGRLPLREFPSEEERKYHAREVVKWVSYGTRQLDRNAQYLYIETYETDKRRIDGEHLYTLNGKPDLVMLHRDHNDEAVLDFVDYKTGKPREDEITPLLLRLIYSNAITFKLGSTSAVRTRFIWSWLNHAYEDIVELDREYYEYQWPVVSGELKRLINEREWVAQPSILCNYCPYQGNHCDQGNGPFPSESWS